MAAARIKSGSVDTSAVAVTIDAWYGNVEVTNRHATQILWVAFGVDPVAAADNVDVVLPGQTRTIKNPVNQRVTSAGTDVRVIGSGSATLYTVKGV